jgi:hypothetical protein
MEQSSIKKYGFDLSGDETRKEKENNDENREFRITQESLSDLKTMKPCSYMIWINPEQWGRFAWTIIFCLVPPTNSDKGPLWNLFLSCIPSILPCIACRKCSQNYLETIGLPPLNATYVQRIHWLLRLRRGIQRRNVEKGNVTKVDATLKGHFLVEDKELEDDNYIVSRFRQTLQIPALFYHDLYVFLLCVSATMDEKRQEKAETWLRCVESLLPAKFKISLGAVSMQQAPLLSLFKRYSVLKHCPSQAVLESLFSKTLILHYSV